MPFSREGKTFHAAVLFIAGLAWVLNADGQEPDVRRRSDPPMIVSSWDDLVAGLETRDDWRRRRVVLKDRFLDLIRDDKKPDRPPLDLQRHESRVVDGTYTRFLVSYNVERDERAHAYLGIPLSLAGKAPAIVALHGTFDRGKEQAAGLVDDPDKAYLDHLCRRGYVVIAPDHFVAGHRIPPEGSYETARFYQRVMDIYELEGAAENFALFVHGRGHSVAHESRQLMYAWMDRHLKPEEATRTHRVEQDETEPAASYRD